MEVDTGVAASLMSEQTQKKLFPDAQLQENTIQLHIYTVESLSVVGSLEVQFRYANYVGKHTLLLVAWNGPILFDRYWLMHRLVKLANVQNNSLTFKNLLTTHSDVCKKELSTLVSNYWIGLLE